MDFVDCRDALCSGVLEREMQRSSPQNIEKKVLSKERLKVETTFIVPGLDRNFWDILWKQSWMGFCHTDDRDDTISGATCSKISDTDLTNSSRHRRNMNVLFDFIPKNIETEFCTDEDITSPLSSPTEQFCTPLEENPTFQTPSKPEKSHRKSTLPQVKRDEFILPSFRSDRGLARNLFGSSQPLTTSEVHRVQERRGSKRGRDNDNQKVNYGFQGWCVISSEPFDQASAILQRDNIQFINIDCSRGSILFHFDHNGNAFNEIIVDDSITVSAFEINKKVGHGVQLEWKENNRTLYIVPLDISQQRIKPSDSVLGQFCESSNGSTGEWGTFRYLEENFASCSSHERFLHLFFLLDILRFERSVYYRPCK